MHVNPAFTELAARRAAASLERDAWLGEHAPARVAVRYCPSCSLTRAFTDGRCNICEDGDALEPATPRAAATGLAAELVSIAREAAGLALVPALAPALPAPTTRAAALAMLRELEAGDTLEPAHIVALELATAPAAKRTRAAKRPAASRHVKAFQAMRFAGGGTCSKRDQENADRLLGLAPSVVAAFRYRPADRAGVLELARVAS